MGAILREGFEAGQADASGWYRPTANPNIDVSSGPISGVDPRVDANGFGGSYFAYGAANRDGGKDFKRSAREFFFRVCLATPNISFNDSTFYCIDQANNTGISFEIETTTTRVGLRRGATFLLSSGTGAIVADTTWRVYEGHVFIDNSSGFYRLYRDLSYVSTLINYSGDTQSSSNNFCDEFRIFIDTQGETCVDDIAVNDITMSYTGGAGTLPSVGDTILGQTSSATAIITGILSGSTAASGTLQLRTVKDSLSVDWSGLIADDPFTGETIDDSLSSNLWTATVTGLDKNSGFPENGFIFGLAPNADVGGKIQLTNTTGPSNYQDVDNRPPDTGDYVFTSTTGNRDVYELENIATIISTTTAAAMTAGDISSIKTVETNVYWQKTDSVLNNGKVIMEHSATEYDSAAKALPLGNYEGNGELYDKIPDGTDFSPANVDTLRVGVKFET